MLYEEITASSLIIKIDLDGNILLKPDFGGLDYGINKAGYVIHGAIHRARHDVACVVHTHTWAGMALGRRGRSPGCTSTRPAWIGRSILSCRRVEIAHRRAAARPRGTGRGHRRLGSIGQALAGWLEAIGLEVRVVRHSTAPAGARKTFTYEALARAVSRADWLVVACPLTDRTRRMVDATVFGAMPRSAHFVNVGRGEVAVETDLVAALSSGHLGGAFLDVFEKEPLSADSLLWSMPNVIATLHSAGMSAGNEGRVAGMFLTNLRARLATR